MHDCTVNSGQSIQCVCKVWCCYAEGATLCAPECVVGITWFLLFIRSLVWCHGDDSCWISVPSGFIVVLDWSNIVLLTCSVLKGVDALIPLIKSYFCFMWNQPRRQSDFFVKPILYSIYLVSMFDYQHPREDILNFSLFLSSWIVVNKETFKSCSHIFNLGHACRAHSVCNAFDISENHWDYWKNVKILWYLLYDNTEIYTLNEQTLFPVF